MNAALRKIGALTIKDFSDLLKNPVTVVCAIMPIGFMLLYRYGMMGNFNGEETIFFTNFLVSIATCMTAGMVGSMVILYTIAEEREKHTLRTLMLANVSAGHVLIAKSIVAMVTIAVVDIICYFVVGADLQYLAPFVLIAMFGSLPVVLIALLCGLFARDQMSSGLYSLPVILLAMVPMVSMLNDTVEVVARFSPCGGAVDLITLLLNGTLMTSDAIQPLIIT
ncbi:MAG: ABC transporter permease, partial [Raoultibacter sp.]